MLQKLIIKRLTGNQNKQSPYNQTQYTET